MNSRDTKPTVAGILACLVLTAATTPLRADTNPVLCAVTFSLPARPASAAPPHPESAPAPDNAAKLHALAQSLWNNLAPHASGEKHELLPPEELATLVQRLGSAGQSDDLDELAAFAPAARRAVASLRARPGSEDYAAWLQNRLDEAEAADAARKRPAPMFVPPPPPPSPRIHVPYYDLWLERVAERPRPSRADQYLPRLRAAFVAEGIPPELVWIAETESAFDPRARGTSGERGLFQLMPETARGLGLRPEERVQPVRSARAAAAYLRYLHERFGDWPLALAAYNAGESRVARELKRRDADNFASISRHLPVVTRFYVPRVLATIKVREGVDPAGLRAPTPTS